MYKQKQKKEEKIYKWKKKRKEMDLEISRGTRKLSLIPDFFLKKKQKPKF